MFRLDPTVRTVPDIEAKYGSQIESSFGDLGADSGLRLGSGRRSPVIVATILLVVGWFLIISTPEGPPARGGRVRPARVAGPAGPDGTAGRSRSRRSSDRSCRLIGYAFLGAYVFTLFHVLRGYQRRDLHPKSYNTIVVRILAAYALALVVGVVYTGPGAEVLLFFVGFMPESALVWLREKMSRTSGLWKAVPASGARPAHATSRASTSTTAPASPRKASTTSKRWRTPTSSTS